MDCSRSELASPSARPGVRTGATATGVAATSPSTTTTILTETTTLILIGARVTGLAKAVPEMDGHTIRHIAGGRPTEIEEPLTNSADAHASNRLAEPEIVRVRVEELVPAVSAEGRGWAEEIAPAAREISEEHQAWAVGIVQVSELVRAALALAIDRVAVPEFQLDLPAAAHLGAEIAWEIAASRAAAGSVPAVAHLAVAESVEDLLALPVIAGVRAWVAAE